MKFYFIDCNYFNKKNGKLGKTPTVVVKTPFHVFEIKSLQRVYVKPEDKLFRVSIPEKKQMNDYGISLFASRNDFDKEHELPLLQVKEYMTHYKDFEISKITRKMDFNLKRNRALELKKMDEEFEQKILKLKKDSESISYHSLKK